MAAVRLGNIKHENKMTPAPSYSSSDVNIQRLMWGHASGLCTVGYFVSTPLIMMVCESEAVRAMSSLDFDESTLCPVMAS